MEQNDRLPIFKERLEELRKLMGNPSNTEFAKTIGISRQTLGFYLNGDRIPDCQTLVQICKKCNVSSNWLLGLSNDTAIKSHSVDELGLSPESINTLLSFRNRDDSSEISEGLNMILESKSVAYLAMQIKRAKDYVQHEASATKQILNDEYDPNESLSSSFTFMDIRDLDLADSLEAEILERHPELFGRIAITCGRSALEKKYSEISEFFDCAIKEITGYYGYLLARSDR